MIDVRYSITFEAKRSRIRRLPRLVPPVLDSSLKRDAQGVIKEFQQGIIKNDLRLEPLKLSTIKRKRSHGAKKPENPLYDLGIDDPRSYVEMMKIVKLKNGYRVRPSSKKHHTSDLKLKDLFDVHEFGATINHPNGVIRIPPRSAFFLAYRRYMNKRRKMEPKPAVEVKRAITRFINEGKEATFKRIREKEVQGIIGDLYEI
jgi:hypothetical protein